MTSPEWSYNWLCKI